MSWIQAGWYRATARGHYTDGFDGLDQELYQRPEEQGGIGRLAGQKTGVAFQDHHAVIRPFV